MIRAPGRLVASPTDLTLDYPYGGTELGKAKLAVLATFGQSFRVPCEGLGGEASDLIGAPSYYVFSCFLRGWDDDAIQSLFQNNFVQGAVSGHSVLREPFNRVGGSSEFSRAIKMLYVPDDIINAPAVVIYAGIPDWTDGAEIAFQRGEELGIPLAVECLRGSTGKIVEVGRLADLSLS
jgi:hypothetical protein